MNSPIRRRLAFMFAVLTAAIFFSCVIANAAELRTDVAKVDITSRAAGPVNDPCFAKLLVLKKGGATAVLITLDAVAIGEIGRIGNGFQAIAREELEKELGIPPMRVGDFKLVTFPGELTVRVGLHIKNAANEPHAFVAGYTNACIQYAPTIEQRNNTGYAQEDRDTLVEREWQKICEAKAL